MNAWDSAASSASSKSLRQPLIDENNRDRPSSRRDRSARPLTVGDCGPPAASNIYEEIMHGEGAGLKLIYSAQTEDDFERAMAEERERDILATTENIKKVNQVFSEVAQLVSAQQQDVDTIESQVGMSSTRLDLLCLIHVISIVRFLMLLKGQKMETNSSKKLLVVKSH